MDYFSFIAKIIAGLILGIIMFIVFLLFIIICSPGKDTPKDKFSIIQYNNHEYIDFRDGGVLHNPDCGFCLSNKLEAVK